MARKTKKTQTYHTVAGMVRQDLLNLVSGVDFMYTRQMQEAGIPSLCMSDGTYGVRKQDKKSKDNGMSGSEPAVAFPTAVTLASTFDRDLARRMGEALGQECRHFGVDVLLGPALNLKRNPRGGRNFEYFSEDPALCAQMAIPLIEGLARQGVGATVKHFALNNSESFRFMGDSIADERTVREVYLAPFQRVIRACPPAAVMCAYNRINGVYCSENAWLLGTVLREEWGYDGLTMTDWGATHERGAGVQAGMDLEMPGGSAHCRASIEEALDAGTLSHERLYESAARVAETARRFAHAADMPHTASADNAPPPPADFAAHDRLCGEIARAGAVLLKNEDNILPLCPTPALPYLVVGEMFATLRYQGAGSGTVHPMFLTTPKDALDARAVAYTHVPTLHTRAGRRALCRETLAGRTVLFFGGLPDGSESEGCDRPDLSLPAGQRADLDILCAAGCRIVLVLFGGAPMLLPEHPAVEGILHMQLPGERGGDACAALLFGEANPSAKLSETYVLRESDIPFNDTFGGEREVYRESVFVGYRYYQTRGVPVAYPFGFGLSYTTFSVRDFCVDFPRFTCSVRNTGTRAGAEVVQLYVHTPGKVVFRPDRELCAFEKVWLQPGEEKQVCLTVEISDLRYYHTGRGAFLFEPGEYTFSVCRDVETVILSRTLFLDGEAVEPPQAPQVYRAYCGADVCAVSEQTFCRLLGAPLPSPRPRLPLTMESVLTDFRLTRCGRVLLRLLLLVPAGAKVLACLRPHKEQRIRALRGALFMRRILLSNCLRSLSHSGPALVPYHAAEAMLYFANGHPWQALRHLLRAGHAGGKTKRTDKKIESL